MKIKQFFSSLLIIAIFATPIVYQLLSYSSPAPDVSFKTITGEHIDLKKLQGTPVIVTFWATDCPACIREIPDLKELYASYHTQGLEIIAINMYYDPPNHVVNMTRAQQLPYPVALDLQGLHAKAFGHVRLTPSTFLISAQGQIIRSFTGAFNLEDMKTRIEKQLNI